MRTMSRIPKLSDNEVHDLAVNISNGTQPQEFLILNALFNKGSGYSSFDSFSDRLTAYVENHKSMGKDEKLALMQLTSSLLQHFRDNETLTEPDYAEEHGKCKSILFP